ncbi:hypothetical protein QBC44DRAFT_392406 [Cladorrhinum sp. PSN332]|nr:hypothetical protein QBC44DRAFT_392406 [Cladorrhinum sp. PSN332]
MASTEEENKPFLAGDQDHGDVFPRDPRRSRWKRLHLALFVVHTLFFILNAALFKHAAPAKNLDPDDDKTFSPVRSAVRYNVQEFQYNHGHLNPFSGEPRPEFDQAWSKLLRSSAIRITKAEMKQMNKTSVALRDGSGYVGYIEAIHMLHCVKRIYQSQYPERYPELEDEDAFTSHHWSELFTNMSGLFTNRWPDHCLEILRQGIMCNADVTVNTYHWDLNKPGRIKGNRSGARKCTDWDSISAWLDSRHLDAGNRDKFLSTLVHGTEGP